MGEAWRACELSRYERPLVSPKRAETGLSARAGAPLHGAGADGGQPLGRAIGAIAFEVRAAALLTPVTRLRISAEAARARRRAPCVAQQAG